MRVVDANVALAWAIPSERTEAAIRLLAEPGDLLAPPLLIHEVTNAVWLMVRQGLLSAAEGDAVREDALAPVTFKCDDQALAARSLEIATELGHPAYDAFYIAAAEAADTYLVTADQRLLSKIKGSRYEAHVRPLTV